MATQKVSVADLRCGMYVANLDRPWSDTRFLFQGFRIESMTELEELRRTCEYVYIDLPEDEDDANKTLRLSMTVRPGANPAPGRSEWQRIATEDRRLTFRREARRAADTRERTRKYVDKLLSDARFGLAIDTEPAKQLVCDLVDDITRNTDTALWLTQLKNVHEYTAQHSVNVSVLSIAFAAHLGFNLDHLRLIGLGALLHDVGKMRTPRHILDKPGRLTREEFDIIKRHPMDGYAMMKATGTIPPQALQIIRYHHERISGRGYPDGLRGEQISMAVRVVAICDVYDAITSDRTYRDRILPDHGLHSMYQMSPTDFGRELMQEFIRCIGIYPVGSVVELTSGALGIVMTKDPHNKLRPVVMLVRDSEGREYRPRRYVCLARHATFAVDAGWQVRRIVDPREAGIDIARIAREEMLAEGHQVVHL